MNLDAPAFQGLKAAEAPREADAVARAASMRFFGLSSEAVLIFRDRALSEARFIVPTSTATERRYVEDDLTRRGFRRACTKREAAASACTWTGSSRVVIDVQGERITARITALADSASAPLAATGRARLTTGTGMSSRETPDPTSAAPAPATSALPTPAAGSTGAAAGAAGAIVVTEAAAAGAAGGPASAPPPTLPDTLALSLDPAAQARDEPRVVYRGTTDYPAVARDAGVQGVVRLIALVDTTGAVLEARIVRSIAELDSAALAQVRSIRFEPVVRDGVVHRFWVRVPVRYTVH
jgi:TonB family protein